MDGAQGSGDSVDRRRRCGKGVWVLYLSTGAALALIRISLLAWIEHRTASHQISETYYTLLWGLRPEILLGEYTRVGAVHFESLKQHFLFWGTILTVGSFIIATPVIVVSWLRQRRR
jgi:hypothetical protein